MFDRSFFDHQRAAFGDDRIVRFLSLLIEELSQRTAAISSAERSGDRVKLAEHAHAVASVAGNLGFSNLLMLGRRLEQDIVSLPADQMARCLDEFRDAIAAATEVARTVSEEVGNANTSSGVSAIC